MREREKFRQMIAEAGDALATKYAVMSALWSASEIIRNIFEPGATFCGPGRHLSSNAGVQIGHFIAEMPLTQYSKIDKQRIRALMVESAGSLQGQSVQIFVFRSTFRDQSSWLGDLCALGQPESKASLDRSNCAKA